MRSDCKTPKKGRPKILQDGEPITTIDMLNLKEKGTQYSKSIKIKESTFFILQDMKDNDEKMKTIDDVIQHLIVLASMVAYGKVE